jgi:hypothetical protein
VVEDRARFVRASIKRAPLRPDHSYGQWAAWQGAVALHVDLEKPVGDRVTA